MRPMPVSEAPERAEVEALMPDGSMEADFSLLRAFAGLPRDWIVAREVELPLATPEQETDRLSAVLLHPGFGIVLLEFEPADTRDAAARFRLRLHAAGLHHLADGQLPVLHLRLPPQRADRLGHALEHAVTQRRVASELSDQTWVRPVLTMLHSRPPAVPQGPEPTPAAVEHATRHARRLPGRLLPAVLACAGAGAVTLYALASFDRHDQAPPPDSHISAGLARAPQASPPGLVARLSTRDVPVTPEKSPVPMLAVATEPVTRPPANATDEAAQRRRDAQPGAPVADPPVPSAPTAEVPGTTPLPAGSSATAALVPTDRPAPVIEAGPPVSAFSETHPPTSSASGVSLSPPMASVAIPQQQASASNEEPHPPQPPAPAEPAVS